MAIFKRKKTDSVLPEVDEYYQAERRDRGWLAWVLAFVSVAIVALIIVGLFLGGRWAYNKIAGNDENEVATTDNTNPNDENLTVDGQQENNTDQTESTDSTAEGTTENTDDTTADQENSTNSDTQANGGQNSSTSTDTPSATPQTGDAGDLPNTGPASLVGVFAGVTTLAGGIHYTVNSRKRK